MHFHAFLWPSPSYCLAQTQFVVCIANFYVVLYYTNSIIFLLQCKLHSPSIIYILDKNINTFALPRLNSRLPPDVAREMIISAIIGVSYEFHYSVWSFFRLLGLLLTWTGGMAWPHVMAGWHGMAGGMADWWGKPVPIILLWSCARQTIISIRLRKMSSSDTGGKRRRLCDQVARLLIDPYRAS